MSRVDATGWRIYGNGQLQTYRSEGQWIVVWHGWWRELKVHRTVGALRLSWGAR